FNGERELAEALGQLAGEAVLAEEELRGCQAVVAVPLAPARQAQRGFNQAAIFAEYIHKRLRLPHLRQVLIRRRETRPQMESAEEQRFDNVKGAFGVTRPASLRGLHLLLVDDIYTTGATVEECARALLRAGARSVSAFVLAIGVTRADWQG
ncbi:MAG: phosphoribosyltransferase family protein, partial [Bacillota bacterium]|nr:phosphoribosyltransferase family protein [Bacillota bacterium]